MPLSPPTDLVDRLVRLQLATAEQVGAIAPRASTLARELPLHPAPWLDALTVAAVISPLARDWLAAGRDVELRYGPYAIVAREARGGLGEIFRARAVETGAVVRLAIYPQPLVPIRGDADDASSDAVPGDIVVREEPVAALMSRLRSLAETAGNRGIVFPLDAGCEHDRLWVASPLPPGRPLSAELARRGRLPPPAVLAIAKQLAAELAIVEHRLGGHGDLSPAALTLAADGSVALFEAGVRTLLAPLDAALAESLPPEACDYLAPEQTAAAALATGASDIYRFGLVLWSLLAGRAPHGGGTGRDRFARAARGQIGDIRRLATNVPERLADLIEHCLALDPAERPASFREIARSIGESTTSDFRLLAAFYAQSTAYEPPPLLSPGEIPGERARQRRQRIGRTLAGLACLVGLIVAGWQLAPAVTRGLRSVPIAATAPPDVSPRSTDLRRSTAKTTAPPPRAKSSTKDVRDTTAPSTSTAIRPRPATGPVSTSSAPTASAALTASAAPTAASSPPNSPPASTAIAPAAAATSESALPQTAPTQVDASTAAATPAPREPRDLVLSSGPRHLADVLTLAEGITVRPPRGERVEVEVPAAGWQVGVDRVRFERIDFVRRRHTLELAAAQRPALIELRAVSATFDDCTFDGGRMGPGEFDPNPAVALRWTQIETSEASARIVGKGSVPVARELKFERCLWQRTAAAIECDPTAAIVTATDVLHLGPGPWIEFPRQAIGSVPTRVRLIHSTFRECQAVCRCYYEEESAVPARWTIEADDCILALADEGTLVELVGEASPAAMVARWSWLGRRSLILPRTSLVTWRRPDGLVRAAREDELQAEGLTREPLQFLGPPEAKFSSNELRRAAPPRPGEARVGVRPRPQLR